MLKTLVVTALLAAGPVLAQPQHAGVSGQQLDQSIPNQNQSQMQTNDSQQPPQVKVLPPTANAQAKPNPLPELSK